VKLANRIGGIAVLIIVLILVLAGIRSSTGNSVLGPLGDTFTAAWRSFRNALPGLTPRRVAGNAGAAAFVGLAIFALAMIFIPAVRGGRNMVILGVVATALGFILYQPTLVGA
jgi:hypothetical protein